VRTFCRQGGASALLVQKLWIFRKLWLHEKGGEPVRTSFMDGPLHKQYLIHVLWQVGKLKCLVGPVPNHHSHLK